MDSALSPVSSPEQVKSLSREYLFDPLLIAKSEILKSDTLQLRPLSKNDFHTSFLQLLSQLTSIGTITAQDFTKTFNLMKESKSYFILVVEDLTTNKIVGCTTLLREYKFIHGCSSVAHIEDVVVDAECRGESIGKALIISAMLLGQRIGCYKIILDCAKHNVGFYLKCGFTIKETQMVHYYEKSTLRQTQLSSGVYESPKL